MRLHDWSGFLALGAAIACMVAIGRGHGVSALVWLLIAMVSAMLTRYWSLTRPGPMPYLLRWTLRIPRGNQSPEHLKRILEPRHGERILEIGPGIGIHALSVAEVLGPSGRLDVFDVQQAMLDDLMGRAGELGITTIVATRGDARDLPYADATFDAAYLVGVLGEIPDEAAALRGLRRVLKPGGRLVVGEVCFDPDFVTFGALRARVEQASFAFERQAGNALSYFARFTAR